MSRVGEVSFTKLEALGNDFVVIDARNTSFQPDPAAVARLGHRRRGIGFDQLLVLRQPRREHAHCEVDIYNNDGSDAEQCGNGMRAIALWLHLRREIGHNVTLDTAAGLVELTVEDAEHITATLGVPNFSPVACGLPERDSFPLEMSIDETKATVSGVSLGNPHLIILHSEPADAEELLRLGRPLSTHPELEHGANIGVVHIEDEHHINLRVFERGAGPTPACGSGACAAAAVLIRAGRVRSPVEVVQPGGALVINWPSEGKPVSMTGPAHQVFQGTIPWPK